MLTPAIEVLIELTSDIKNPLTTFVERVLADRDNWPDAAKTLASQRRTIQRRLDTLFFVIDLLLGGSQATNGQYPECVAIGNATDGFFGSGVLLTRDWLLTSAHCRNAEFAATGVSSAPWAGLARTAEKDLLALFKVSDFPTEITPPRLLDPQCTIDPGTPLRVVAFGESDPAGGTFGEQREAPFSVTDAYDLRIYATSDSAVCPGDSGGPAFYDDASTPRLLLGICDSVIGDDCAEGGVFASLAGKKKWIEDTTSLTFATGCPGTGQAANAATGATPPPVNPCHA